MARYIQNGRIIDYQNTGSEDIRRGDVVVGADRAFVAATEIPVGGTGTLETEGVYEVTAVQAASLAFGQVIYFDAENKTATASDEGNTRLGVAVEEKAAGTGICKVKLC